MTRNIAHKVPSTYHTYRFTPIPSISSTYTLPIDRRHRLYSHIWQGNHYKLIMMMVYVPFFPSNFLTTFAASAQHTSSTRTSTFRYAACFVPVKARCVMFFFTSLYLYQQHHRLWYFITI